MDGIDGIDSLDGNTHTRKARPFLLRAIHAKMQHEKDKVFAWMDHISDPNWLPMRFTFELSLLVSVSLPLTQKVHLTQSHLASALSRTEPKINSNSSSIRCSTSTVVLGCVETALIEEVSKHNGFVEALTDTLLSVLTLANCNNLHLSHEFVEIVVTGLAKVFNSCSASRRRILSRCVIRLAISEKDTSSVDATVRTLSLLHRIVRQNAALIAQHHVEEVQQALYHLLRLPPAVAMLLIVALAPLCSERQDLQNHAASVLKKAMLNNDVKLRLLGTRGFLYLIYSFLETNTNVNHAFRNEAETFDDGEGFHEYSQACVPCLSQMDAMTGGFAGSVTLLHELAGFMRRGLQQEPEVRQVLYQSIPVLLSADPAAVESIAEVLMTQIEEYFVLDATPPSGSCTVSDPHTPPINFKSCIDSFSHDNGMVVEPLHCLLSCIQKTLQIGKGLTTMVPMTALESLGNRMLAIRDTLCAAPLEEYCLVRQAVMSAAVDKPNENQQRSSGPTQVPVIQGSIHVEKSQANLLIACYEAMMESVIVSMGATASEHEIQMLSSLFSHHQRLSKLLSNSKTPVLLEPKDYGSSISSYHKMGSPCLIRLLQAVLNDGFGEGDCTNEERSLVRDPSFQLFVLQTCYTALKTKRDKKSHVPLLFKYVQAEATPDSLRIINALFDEDDDSWEELVESLIQCTRMFILAGAREQSPTGPQRRAKKKADKVTMGMLLDASLHLMVELLLLLLPLLPTMGGGHYKQHGSTWQEKLVDALFLSTDDRLSLKDVFYVLVDHACRKEIEKLCCCLESLMSHRSTGERMTVLSSRHVKEISRWLDYAYASAPRSCGDHIGAAKRLVSCRLQSHCFEYACAEPSAHLDPKPQLEIFKVLEQVFCDIKTKDTVPRPLITQKTGAPITAIALSFMDSCISRLQRDLQAISQKSVLQNRKSQASDAKKDFCLQQLFGLVSVGASVADSQIQMHGSGHGEVSSTKVLTKLYKTLATATKYAIQAHQKQTDQEGLQPRCFLQLANLVHSKMTPKIYNLKAELQCGRNCKTSQTNRFPQRERQFGDEIHHNSLQSLPHNPSGVGSSTHVPQKRKRHPILGRGLPDLVFAVEEWERQAIKLSKLWGVNLMQNAKRSSNWDFRVQTRPNA